MSSRDAVTALRRFGLGARPGELQAVAGDPRGYVLAQLERPVLAQLEHPALEASYVIFARTAEAQQAQKAARDMAAQMAAAPATGPVADSGAAAMNVKPPADVLVKPGQVKREAIHDEREARLSRARTTDTPLLERLVAFWSNHFCVSIAKGQVRGLVGPYEREAIRPRILGRFADLLRSVEQHPAMLLYLDNAPSIGPNSKAGKNRGKGLNENLAREILELHTVGVAAGYTQDDVANLARLLTGWSIASLSDEARTPGTFHFAAPRHEPGRFTVLGRAYGDEGVRAGLRCLDDLARHPATARRVAGKLVAHFVGDNAPPALTARLERRFLDTEGDLAAVTRELVAAPEAWEAPAAKVVPPYDWLVAIARGFSPKTEPGEFVRLAGTLGQPLWEAPTPKGWPDADESWMAPSPLRERLRIAGRIYRDIDGALDPRAAAEALFGGALGAATRQAVMRADSRQQGFEILTMSPEFLRR